MTCPDPTVRMFFAHWLFDVFQLIFVCAVWTLLCRLWLMGQTGSFFRKK